MALWPAFLFTLNEKDRLKASFASALLVFIFITCTDAPNHSVEEARISSNTTDSSALYALHTRRIDSIKQIVQETDIVFRGGTDIESETIREFSEQDKLFSHCGIVVFKDSALVVAHMIGGISNPAGGIRFEPLKQFLSYPNNKSAGVYGTNFSAAETARLYAEIDSIKAKGIGFDLKFNLFTKDNLYCTELLIDVIHQSKKNNTLFAAKKYNLRKTKYSFLANKGSYFFFYPIDAFQHSNSLILKKIFIF